MTQRIYAGQMKSIGTHDIYEPKVTNQATIAAAIRAGLVRTGGQR